LAKRIGYDIGPVQAAVVGAGMSESMARAIELLKIGLTAEELLSGSDYPLVVRDDGMEATYGTRPKLTLPEGMQGRYVPLLSYAQAGAWDASHSDALYDHTAIFALNVDDRRAFAIKVTGNSMEPSLPEGDIVICSPGAELRNGEAAVIRTRSEQVFIKFWEKRGERVTLSSANPDYDPIHLPLAEIAGAWAVVQHIASGKVKKE
jgi:SOS-response transcriptional repressor LexA